MFKIIRSEEAAKLQWLQDPSQTNEYNVNNIKCATSRTFRYKQGNI